MLGGRHMIKSYVGVTDFDWFQLLREEDGIEEINFWQPGGKRQFKTLAAGDLFLFKLKSPRNFIVGGGTFAHSTLVPISLAWSAFGRKNGVRSLAEMRARTLSLRHAKTDSREDCTIGCIVLTHPFFLPEERWIPAPLDWKPNIVQGKTYDLSVGYGAEILEQLQARRSEHLLREVPDRRYGEPITLRPRLGQGGFRMVITDAYERRCALTGERVLPVLEAAHVRPYSEGGEHRADNGLLLRSDLHTLLDRGYLTVTPDARVKVSPRIREEFENGRDYYALDGSPLRNPVAADQQLGLHNIKWHNEHCFLG